MCELHTSSIKAKPIQPTALHDTHIPTKSSSKANTLTQANWRNALEAEAKKLRIDPEDLKALLKAKGLDNPMAVPSFNRVINLKDGSGCKLFGMLNVHSGLLANGKWANTEHGLKHKNGKAMTGEELASNPMLAMQAGLMHVKNLLNTYNGDAKKAVNHFMTGNPLGRKADSIGCACCEDEHPKPTPSLLHSPKPSIGHEDHGQHDHNPNARVASPETPLLIPSILTPTPTPALHDGPDHSGHAHSAHQPATPTPTPTPALHDGHDHLGHAHDTHQPATAMAGDVPVFESHASGHIGHGHGNPINAPLHNSALTKIFGDQASIPSIIASNDKLGAYNPGQSAEQKQAGAYLVANILLKLDMAPLQERFSEPQLQALSKHSGVNVGVLRTLSLEVLNGLMYGTLKNLALKNNAADIRELIKDMGLNTVTTAKLTDAELLNVWATNEHNNLHGILFGNSKIYNVIHLTSLNDKDAHTKTSSLSGKVGGFNDKGEYPQWGWLEDAQTFSSKYLA